MQRGLSRIGVYSHAADWIAHRSFIGLVMMIVVMVVARVIHKILLRL
jgi:hypothetical protein